ncbi:hypothetical protein SLEP1_g6171 [Rubroshorea leprosula]|uniref:Reverse transcriptase Ty1/copia-type domain-containing protein n=1 Tax=Rubroshorea leprosula TaxID=152421 RepID=A0AAV5I2H0_9ROSI|nr:hypothetical protein SLEP1_g6171 [Rubroshorea leprosula]
MLFEKNLPKKFWAEVVHIAIYLLNGLPTRVIEGKTLVDAWFGLKPLVYHLKVKSLADVYARCNLATSNPTCFIEASKHDEWMVSMREELAMIEKNKTWSLCPRLEEIYVEQLEGFLVHGSEDTVYKLHKALYGLKQASRAWYRGIDAYLMQQGSDVQAMKDFMLVMKKEFDMSDLGEMSYFLGLEIKQCGNGLFLSQQKYAWDMMRKFNMESIIGSLLYLNANRPDIIFATSLLSRYMSSLTQVQLSVAKRVLRYVNGTVDYGICFGKNDHGGLSGYLDSDWVWSIDDAGSTSGYLFQFGIGVFCWNSCKHEVVAQSTIEAKYISIVEASNHTIWLRKMLFDMG